MSGRLHGRTPALPDERAEFGNRVESVMPDLLRYFVRRVSPQDDAYDCVSEVLVVLWRRRSSAPADPEEFRAWSFGVAHRVLLNHSRSARRRLRLAEKLRAEPQSAAVAEERTLVTDALAQLTDVDRELVTLVVWDELGVAEAGAVLGLRAVAARSRYSRARSRLRQLVALAETRVEGSDL